MVANTAPHSQTLFYQQDECELLINNPQLEALHRVADLGCTTSATAQRPLWGGQHH